MLIYLLKVNFLTLVFSATYWLLLRKGKLLQLNRLILATSIILAFLLPMLPLGNFPGESVTEPVKELTARATTILPEIGSLTETFSAAQPKSNPGAHG
jgi:hypothetical protein